MSEIGRLFRALTKAEEKLVARLLGVPFKGRDELLQQLADVKARQLDETGSLELMVSGDRRAPIDQSPAVEARYPDLDTIGESGAHINVLLDVKAGKLWMLEFYKDDSSEILEAYPAGDIWLFSQHGL